MGKKHGHGKHGRRGQPAPLARLAAVPGATPLGGAREPAAGAPPAGFRSTLAQASVLLESDRWAEARILLEPLVASYPRDITLLRSLCLAYQGAGDWQALEQLCERLSGLDPRDGMTLLLLAEARANNERVVLALRAARQALALQPRGEQAATARMIIAELEPEVKFKLDVTGLPPEHAFEMMALHEQALAHVQRQEYAQARQTEERLLRTVAGYAPALNTIALAYAQEGRLAAAITTVERVLARDPANLHALANLVSYLCRAGRPAAATEWAAKLAALDAPLPDAWIKKAEAFSYLGDDLAVMHAYEEAQETQHGGHAAVLPPDLEHPLGLHLVAVAAWRLGREAEARKLWRRALKRLPGFSLAQTNLDDLRKPIAQRHAPWPFSVDYWVSQATIRDLLGTVEEGTPGAHLERKEQLAAAGLARHPELAGLAPLLLDHGDPAGRQFALLLARGMKTPQLLAALRDFALGQRGPDDMRVAAANVAAEGGVLPSGMTRLWIKGAWTELMLLGFEIYDEAGDDDFHFAHSAQVEGWLAEGIMANYDKDYKTAEARYRQAMAVEPEAGDILNNLASVLEITGRHDESRALIEQVLARYPDYLFARVNEATHQITLGNFARARELIEPAMRRHRLHISEFRALCSVQIQLFLAEGNAQGAQSWLEMWERIEPEYPDLDGIRLQVALAGMSDLADLLRRRPRRGTKRQWTSSTPAIPVAEPQSLLPPPRPTATRPRRANMPALKRSPGLPPLADDGSPAE